MGDGPSPTQTPSGRGPAPLDCLAEARVCTPAPALPVLPSGLVIALLYSAEEETSGFEGGGHARGRLLASAVLS